MIHLNRILMSTTSTGAGDLVVAAMAGSISLADRCTAETQFSYLLRWGDDDYEIGIGNFVPPNTVQRTWVLHGSQLGMPINTLGAAGKADLPAGTKLLELTALDIAYLAAGIDEQEMQNYTPPVPPVATGNGALAGGVNAKATGKAALALGQKAVARHLRAVQIGRGFSLAPSSMLFGGGWVDEQPLDMTMLGPLAGEQVININCSDNGFFNTIGAGSPYGKVYAEMIIFANGDADTYIGRLKYAILDGVLTVIQPLTTEFSTLGSTPTAVVVLSEDMDDYGNNLVKITYTCPAAVARWVVSTRLLARI